MAGRIRNRMELRRQAELAEERGPRARSGQPTAAAVRRAGAGGQRGQARICARWGVFDGAMKLIETFDYNQRAQADLRAAELNAIRKNGTTYFVQVVKESFVEPGPVNLD